MTNEPGYNDQIVGWGLAAAIAAVGFVLLLALGGYGIVAGAFLAGVLFLVIGGLISWLFCSPLPKLGEVPPPGQKVSTKPTTVAAAPTAKAAPKAAAKSAPAAKTAAPKAAKPKAAAPKAAAPKAAKTEAGKAAEGDGKQPEALAAPRDDGPDNLKEIKGVGPKLEKMCHDLGIYHFDQIAGWGPDEIAWMDENLKGFKGRVTRDNWIEQAKTLAAGGETEFSKRVDGGDVY